MLSPLPSGAMGTLGRDGVPRPFSAVIALAGGVGR